MSDFKIAALGKVPLFAGSGRTELEFLVTRTDEVSVQAGRTLITEGHPADTFYLLLEGEASVQVDGRDRPPLRAGSFFGEISMLDRGPATATAAPPAGSVSGVDPQKINSFQARVTWQISPKNKLSVYNDRLSKNRGSAMTAGFDPSTAGISGRPPRRNASTRCTPSMTAIVAACTMIGGRASRSARSSST